MNKPVMGITMGDPAGVGPELCLRVVQDPTVLGQCVPVVFGDAATLRAVSDATGVPFAAPVMSLDSWTGVVAASRAVIVDCGGLRALPRPGAIQAACGDAARRYIEVAVREAIGRRIAGIVTNPIHKEAFRLAGVPHPGHTEMLAALTGSRDVCMMMASDELVVSLVTTHVAVADVSRGLTVERLVRVMELTAGALRRLGTRDPRLTVCALNPHAGEHGLFGAEEATVIGPAMEVARKHGIRAEGPLPPDTAFLPERRKGTDAYVVMYHDQGLIPFKMLAFDRGVNMTLGLPIVRTSVDHGTAFDIAWKGTASPNSLIQAVRWAVRLGAATSAA